MFSIRLIRQLCIACLLSLTMFNTLATKPAGTTSSKDIPFYRWYEVLLPADTGASCGNGTPLRFYVNRAQSPNMLFRMEEGGACWNFETCTETSTGPEKGLGGFNPRGIPAHYMDGTFQERTKTSFGTPLMIRLGFGHWLFGEPPIVTQKWTQVFVPYCTGDIHMGSGIQRYPTRTGSGLVREQHFNGVRNIQAVTKWLVDNGLGKPDRLLVYGISAGGYGTLGNYASIRNTLQPQQYSSLLNDAGTTFITPFNADPATHPSVGLYKKVHDEWNMLAPDGMIAQNSKLLKNYDPSNMGSVYVALSTTFPHDRFGYSTYQQDKIEAAYHYRAFVQEVIAAPNDKAKDELALAKFDKELDVLKQELNRLPNFGYFMPWARNGFIGNHSVTAVSFTGSKIHENGINANVGDFVNDLLSEKDPSDTPVMKAFRTKQSSDFTWSSFFALMDRIFNLTGEGGPISSHKA